MRLSGVDIFALCVGGLGLLFWLFLIRGKK